MKKFAVVIGSFLVVMLVASWAHASPLPQDDDDDDAYFEDGDTDEDDDDYYLRRKRQADYGDDEGYDEEDEDENEGYEDEEDDEDYVYIRNKREFEAKVETSDGPGGKQHSVQGSYSKSFNDGKTSVSVGGYGSWGDNGSDKGGFAELKHRW